EDVLKLADLDVSAEARWVHFCLSRREDEIDALSAANLQVFLQWSWIARQVLVRPELRRVDENANDNEPGLGPSGPDQADVAGVQRPHRRHEADGQTARSRSRDRLANGIDRADDNRPHAIRLTSGARLFQEQFGIGAAFRASQAELGR